MSKDKMHILTLKEFEKFSSDIKEDLIDEFNLENFDEVRDWIEEGRIKYSQAEYEKRKPLSRIEFAQEIEKLELEKFGSFVIEKQEKVANQGTLISN